MESFISSSFGDGRTEKAVSSRCWLPIIFHYRLHTHRRFRVFYYRLENASSSHHGAKHRVSTLLVVRYIIDVFSVSSNAYNFGFGVAIYKYPIRGRFIPESARWLLTKGRLQEAKDLLQRASLENGVEMPDEALDTLLNNNSEDSMPDARKPSLFDLFRYPNLRRKSILLFFNWYDHFVSCFMYFVFHVV